MIRGADGLEYADEAALLLREPRDCTFNGNIRVYRGVARRRAEAEAAGRQLPGYWDEEKIRKYIEGFASVCPQGDPGPSTQYAQAHDAGLRAAAFTSRPRLYGATSSSGPITGKRATFIVFDELSSIRA